MSFQQAISGLNATARNIDVIGNNIANAGTIGAKTSRAEFADMYSSAISGSTGKQAGVGVAVAAVTQMFNQGSITSTNSPLDMAINGNGFFQVQTAGDAVHYSRNGQFRLDREGFIANAQGNKLMGYTADDTGAIQRGQARVLQLTELTMKPVPTTAVTISANLDSRVPIIADAFDPSIAATYNWATSLDVVDPNGKLVDVTLYFTKTAEDTWTLNGTANGAPFDSGLPVDLAFVDASFADPATFLISGTTVPTQTLFEGVNTMPLDLDLTAFTQFALASSVSKVSKDGYPAGELMGLVVENTGVIRANYSNGEGLPIGQIELATFSNLNGLRPLGGNEWAETLDSGEPIRGEPATGSLGALQTSALEESNVDLTSELVQMMIAQRTYQANAQTIKTQDQVLQTLVNMR